MCYPVGEVRVTSVIACIIQKENPVTLDSVPWTVVSLPPYIRDGTEFVSNVFPTVLWKRNRFIESDTRRSSGIEIYKRVVVYTTTTPAVF